MTERTSSSPLLSRRFHLVLLHLAEEARRDLDRLSARESRAIHSVRTRMKNLRALLLLVKARIPKPERKTVTTLAGRLKDAFSEQRDTDVVAGLRAKFPALRGTAAQKTARTNHTTRDRKAKADASRLIRLMAKLGLAGLAWADVIGGYLRSYRAGRKAMKSCAREETAEAFHDWRRPVKDIFHQSQALQPLDGMRRRRKAAERLADRLGEMNDLHMLRAVAKRSREADAEKHIAKRQRALRTAIFKAGKKLFSERPDEIERALKRCVKFHPAILARAVRQT